MKVEGARTGRVERITKESSVLVEVNLDGTGHTEISTGMPFFDHMLASFGKHGAFDLGVRATGDLEVDSHHTVEDVSIVLGQAFRVALGDKSGIRRFGDSWIPMDEALAQAVVDVSGRPYCVHTGEPESMAGFVIGGHYPTVLNRHVFESLAFHAERLKRHADDYAPKIRGLLEEALACPAHEYARCKEHQRLLTAAVRPCFQGVDALLTPATTNTTSARPMPAAALVVLRTARFRTL